jgi:hypothetical protein
VRIDRLETADNSFDCSEDSQFIKSACFSYFTDFQDAVPPRESRPKAGRPLTPNHHQSGTVTQKVTQPSGKNRPLCCLGRCDPGNRSAMWVRPPNSFQRRRQYRRTTFPEGQAGYPDDWRRPPVVAFSQVWCRPLQFDAGESCTRRAKTGVGAVSTIKPDNCSMT